MVVGQGNIYTQASYGPEASAYGTEAAAYAALARAQSVSIESTNNLIFERGLGEGVNAVKTYWGPFECSGSATFNVTDFDFLKHWVGAKAGAGSVGSPYTLTEATSIATTAGAGVLQPFSLEVANVDTPTTSQFALGCVGTEFELSGELNGILTCTASFVGQKSGYRSTAASYTPSTEGSFVMLNGTWKWGATPTALAGVRRFSIKYSNGLVTGDDTRTIESRFITVPKLGTRTYDFSIEILANSALATTLINDFYGYVNTGVYTPETGSVSISPTASLEFKIEFISGNKYANLSLDEAAINRIGRSATLGQGLVILTIEGTTRKGLAGVPITWWSV